jgi:hypothetical protein
MHNTNPKAHWEKVYTEKAPEAVSWYRPHFDTSLALPPAVSRRCRFELRQWPKLNAALRSARRFVDTVDEGVQGQHRGKE